MSPLGVATPDDAPVHLQELARRREGHHPRAQLGGARDEAGGDLGGIEPAVARHVADGARPARLEVGRELLGLGGRDELRLDVELPRGVEPLVEPRLAGLGVGRLEAAGAVKAHRPAHGRFEVRERLAGLVAKPRHHRHVVGLAREPRRPRRGLRPERVLVEQHHVGAAPRQVVGGGRPEGARADDDHAGGLAAGIGQSLVEPRGVRVHDGPRAAQEVEVHALVGLEHVVEEHARVAARRRGRPRGPGGAAARQLLVAHVQRQPSVRHVELDEVAVLDEGERAADRRLGRHVQDHGAVGRAAHPRVRDAHHVLHARLEEPRRDGRRSPLGHARAALGPGVLQHEHRGLLERDGGVVDALGDLLVVVEDHGAASVRQEMLGRRRLLEHGAAGAEVAEEDDGAALGGQRQRERPDDVGVVAGRVGRRFRPASCRSPCGRPRGAGEAARGGRRAGRPRSRSPPSGTCPTAAR